MMRGIDIWLLAQLARLMNHIMRGLICVTRKLDKVIKRLLLYLDGRVKNL